MSDFSYLVSEKSSLEQVARPNLQTWLKHFFFFFLTFSTATLAGSLYPFGSNLLVLLELDRLLSDYASFLHFPAWGFFLALKGFWFLFQDFENLKQGLSFSVPLMIILTAHEFGHYIACRIYNVDATLPYFIPVPILSPAGTLGAFIKILSPMPSRRAIFDIGVAGPIAGFVALIPVLFIAFLTMTKISPETVVSAETDLYFSDGLLVKIFALIFGYDLSLTIPNGFYFAAWVGLLVTSLNLIPSGQLDGGHAVFAVFGEKIHHLTGRIAFAVMVILCAVGIFIFNSPSGLLFAILLGFMMKMRHPEPLDNTPLDFKRKVIAFITLLIFVLSFVPFPIKSGTSLF